ncbi:MAG: CO dehydrogenase/CO-methylating acetyl-CoA synthase complex subunit beta, partial [Candidatus Omnitrophica bacterium]|nr:CO dehydrogenase/CO-methylating acetyl-CoA synthase complex subunit beta [Candidatus Omnitrophota bacterium]
MPQAVVNAAIKGARSIVDNAEKLLDKTIKEKGKDHKLEFPETGYFLPLIYATLGKEVKSLKDAEEILDTVKTLMKKIPDGKRNSPLDDAMDSGVVTAFAAEIIEAIRYVNGELPEEGWQGFIPDSILRSLGIQLVDGRISGVAVVVGAAPDGKTAEKIIRELQEKNILTLLVSGGDGNSMKEQLVKRKVQLGLDFYVVPVGKEVSSFIHAANFAIRASLSYGGNKKGELEKNINYCKERVPAFIMALGPLDEIKIAAACAAIRLGFPVITDQNVPAIKETPFTLRDALIP